MLVIEPLHAAVERLDPKLRRVIGHQSASAYLGSNRQASRSYHLASLTLCQPNRDPARYGAVRILEHDARAASIRHLVRHIRPFYGAAGPQRAQLSEPGTSVILATFEPSGAIV